MPGSSYLGDEHCAGRSPIGCNGIHYSVIFWYGYCYCKEIEGLYDQPATRTRTKG